MTGTDSLADRQRDTERGRETKRDRQTEKRQINGQRIDRQIDRKQHIILGKDGEDRIKSIRMLVL